MVSPQLAKIVIFALFGQQLIGVCTGADEAGDCLIQTEEICDYCRNSNITSSQETVDFCKKHGDDCEREEVPEAGQDEDPGPQYPMCDEFYIISRVAHNGHGCSKEYEGNLTLGWKTTRQKTIKAYTFTVKFSGQATSFQPYNTRTIKQVYATTPRETTKFTQEPTVENSEFSCQWTLNGCDFFWRGFDNAGEFKLRYDVYDEDWEPKVCNLDYNEGQSAVEQTEANLSKLPLPIRIAIWDKQRGKNHVLCDGNKFVSN